MAGGSNGYRAALVRHQLTPGLISSFPGTAGLPRFISFSTSYLELPDVDADLRLLNDLVGATEQLCWHFEAKCLGRFEVDH